MSDGIETIEGLDGIDSEANTFNYVRFIKFLSDNNIIAVAIAAVLSNRIIEVTNEFVKEIIMPILNFNHKKDMPEEDKFENKKLVIAGIEFGIGKMVHAIIKFCIIISLLFLMSNILRRAIKKPIDFSLKKKT